MCWPTRASLLTGLYAKTALPDKGSAAGGLHAAAQTLPRVLNKSGYSTYMAGKWHLSSAEEPNGANAPHNRGFDKFYGTIHGASDFFAPAGLILNGVDKESEWEDNPDYYYTDAKTNYALRFLKDHNKEKPFFMYLSYTSAHWPLHAQPADIAHYKGKFSQGWDKLREERFGRMKEMGVIAETTELSLRDENVVAYEEAENHAWQERRMEVYAAQITSMDRNIGRVIQQLKQSGQFENTLVIFQHDNGGCHVEYTTNRKGSWSRDFTTDGKKRPIKSGNIPGLMPGDQTTFQSYGVGWANASNTPFRKSKSYDHEGGSRSPLIMSWPNGLSENLVGKMSDEVCHVIDMMPTLLDVAEVDTFYQKPMPLEGRSFKNSLLNQEKHLRKRGPLFWSHSKGRAVRVGDWKLVAEGKNKWELYDLEKDPVELYDRSKEMPEKVMELERLFADWDKRTNLGKKIVKKNSK